MKKRNLMPSVILGSICLVVALLLSVINMITGPAIEAAQKEATQKALRDVLPLAESDFTELTLNEKYPAAVTEGYSADAGYVFKMVVTGYKPGLTILCGIDNDGVITGAKYIESNETLSAEVGLGDKFVGYKNDNIESIKADIEASSTAKATTGAYYSAIEAALKAYIVATGGEVDLRTPEQIHQDNCNDALGTTELVYVKWFETEILENVKSIYTAEGTDGCVIRIGEKYIGVNAQGEVVGSASDEDKSAALTAYDTYKNTHLTEQALHPDSHPYVLKAYVTDSGNYVFDMKAESNNTFNYEHMDEINGAEYWADNTFILFSVSISKDGEIIDCVTKSHKESGDYGAAIQTEAYYDKWVGVTSDEIQISVIGPIVGGYISSGTMLEPGAVDIINTSTVTAHGYQKSMKYAFEAFELLTGGNA